MLCIRFLHHGAGVLGGAMRRYLADAERMTNGPRPVLANGTRLKAMASSIISLRTSVSADRRSAAGWLLGCELLMTV